jgi:hypothetical protein
MPGRLGPRFAIEVVFLIALATGAGLADLEARWIVLVMAAGWLVVALLELTAERLWATVPPWRRPYYPSAAPRVDADASQRRRPPEPAVEAEPETVIVSRVAVAESVESRHPEEAIPAPSPERQPEPDPEPEPEPLPRAVTQPESARPELEPLEPRSKRRWFRRGAEPHRQQEARPAPKHVRLLATTPRQDRIAEEVAEIFDGPDREEEGGSR